MGNVITRVHADFGKQHIILKPPRPSNHWLIQTVHGLPPLYNIDISLADQVMKPQVICLQDSSRVAARTGPNFPSCISVHLPNPPLNSVHTLALRTPICKTLHSKHHLMTFRLSSTEERAVKTPRKDPRVALSRQRPDELLEGTMRIYDSYSPLASAGYNCGNEVCFLFMLIYWIQVMGGTYNLVQLTTRRHRTSSLAITECPCRLTPRDDLDQVIDSSIR